MDFLLGSEDDEGRARGRSRGSGKVGRGRRRRRRRNRGGFLAPLLAVIVLVGIIGGGGYYGYLWLSDALVPDDFKGPGTTEVVIQVKDGQTAADVAKTLQAQGVVASERAFTNAIAAAGKSSELRPGQFTLKKGMSAAAAVEALVSGKKLQNTVLIKEGERLTKVFDILAKQTKKSRKEFVAAAKDKEAIGLPSYAKSLEGYAFPATYEFEPNATPTQMLTQMVDRYTQAASATNLEESAKQLGLTPGQIMTVASIVQAEAGTYEDMPKIAEVIYNRLSRKPAMKLQMDSTVMYALNKYGIAASHADLETKSKFNTYMYEGLPPGPISNPGEHAIEAALKPSDSGYLYFVTTDPKNKVTKFTASEAEFWKLKAEFERNGGG
ncbi:MULTISPECIES: endolytic transglycosylase MltG [unclassified Nonomuraea]|uniref:endolytic transglycosylase MltG n=1 Tax=Nonomuraea sp. NPDC003804 TaxID=3154547 RepID=UPI0033AB552E